MKRFSLIIWSIGISLSGFSQGVLVGPTGGSPDPASVLEIRSDSQGLLPPRLTTQQRDEIENPPAGLRIYNSDTGCENFYSGVTQKWMSVCGSCAPFAPADPTAEATAWQMEWSWTPVEGATGYKWSETNDYYAAIDLGPATSFVQSNSLGSGQLHVAYIWSYNEACGESERPRRVTSTPCYDEYSLQPSPNDHIISSDQITWRWNGGNASGFKWNTVDDYSTAIDVGLSPNYNQTYTQTGLSPETEYTVYVWGYDSNGSGCYSSSVALTATTATAPCTVGATGPGGGVIYYCGSAYPGKIGLEISAADNSSGTSWGCQGSDLSGAGGNNIGQGLQNTTDIVNGCATAGIAARLCSDLTLGGESDWFLPSIYEIQTVMVNLNHVPTVLDNAGIAPNVYYWTSTEAGTTSAMTTSRGSDGTIASSTNTQKSQNRPVRCVRAF